jgi:hypothetical protein
MNTLIESLLVMIYSSPCFRILIIFQAVINTIRRTKNDMRLQVLSEIRIQCIHILPNNVLIAEVYHGNIYIVENIFFMESMIQKIHPSQHHQFSFV